MNLYGDIPKSKNKKLDCSESAGVAAWIDVAKAPQPAPTTASSVEEPSVPVISKPERLAPPPSVLKKNRGSGVSQEVSVGNRETEQVKYGYSFFGDLENEYDPSKPNDYEEVMKERERKKREAEVEAERQEQLIKELEDKERVEKEKREQAREEQEKALSYGHENSKEASAESSPKTGAPPPPTGPIR